MHSELLARGDAATSKVVLNVRARMPLAVLAMQLFTSTEYLPRFHIRTNTIFRI